MLKCFVEIYLLNPDDSSFFTTNVFILFAFAVLVVYTHSAVHGKCDGSASPGLIRFGVIENDSDCNHLRFSE